MIDINLTGSFLMAHAFLPLMKERGWGRIINFGSGSVFDGTRNQTHYVAAKAGIVGFTRSLAREVGGYGITVNVITPGLTVTRAVRDHFPTEILEAQRKARALPRDEEPEDLVGPGVLPGVARRGVHHRADAQRRRRQVHAVSHSETKTERGPDK